VSRQKCSVSDAIDPEVLHDHQMLQTQLKAKLSAKAFSVIASRTGQGKSNKGEHRESIINQTEQSPSLQPSEKIRKI
jgi:hypothetical protein